jgi:tetratricopeptide (TPR) repeat protein
MASIFLSYARKDFAKAQRVAGALEAAGHSVWWDRQLHPGERFSAEIDRALKTSDAVVALWSRASIESAWVQDEAGVGRDTGRLVPALLEPVAPPLGFRQYHAVDLSRGRLNARSIEPLVQAVQDRLSGKRSKAEAPAKPRFAALSTRPLWAIAAALALVAAVVTALFVTNQQQATGQVQAPTIALLPFKTTSPDPALRDLAAQTRDSIAHTFSQGGLPVQLLSSAPQGRPVADFLFGGDFSRNGDKVQATIRLDEAAHGITVYSQQFEAVGEDTRNLPERIGVQLAGTFTFTPKWRLLDRRHPIDPPLLADLLAETDDLQAYLIRKRVAAKIPNVAIAQAGVAFYTGFVLSQLPRAERAEALAEGRRAADRARAIDPTFGDIYFAWCNLHSEVRLAECEDELRAGRRIDPDSSSLNRHLFWKLRDVGRFDEAAELASLAYAHNPYDAGRMGDMLWVLEYTGDDDGARQLYQKALRWFPENKSGFAYNRLWGLVDRGHFDAIPRLAEEIGPGVLPPEDLKGRALLALLNAKTIPAAKQICLSAIGDNKILCMFRLSSLGDQDDAYALAEKIYPRRVGRSPAETEQIWLDDPEGDGPRPFITSPAAAPMRRDPRYLELAQRVGLLDYWRSGRAPDFCRKNPEPICSQLVKRR